MAGSKPLHFRETVPVKNTLWRAADLLILSLLAALLCSRLCSTRRREALWIVAFLCEAWFTFVWLLYVNSKWNPVVQITYPERLSKRWEDLPAVDMFLTTANPELEPPMITVNTVLSLLAVDYPPHKLACYVSDDGFSAATYRAVVEAAEFARSWVPFCKKYAVQVRAPLHYFSGEQETSPSISPDFLHDWKEMKSLYQELRRRVEDAHLGGGHIEPIFSQFDREKHPSVIKAIWENKGDLGDGVPHLFYVAREKSPSHHHHFKGGAMNVLTRVSGLITNAPFMVNVDCDMFVNNPAIVLHAMCLLLGFDTDQMSGFVQCPQRFHGAPKDDPFGNQMAVLTHFVGRGIEGLQGSFYYGTGCFHRRNAIYGEPPDGPPPGKPSPADLRRRFGSSRRLQSSAADIISGLRKTSLAIDDLVASMQAAVDVARCSYEIHSLWGDQVGWAYGSATEDIQTGLRIQAKGWRSVTLDPQPPAFLGIAPTGGPASLTQTKRWATGALENVVGQHSPLLASVNGKLGPRQCLAYLLLNLWAPRSLPELCYALLTPFSVVANTSFLPAGRMAAVPAAIFAAYNIYTVAEYLAVGESLRSWWNNQRMRRIGAATAYLFGLLSVAAKLVGLSESAFEITKKEVDAPPAAAEAGRFSFDASPLFLPAAAVALLNSAALPAATWRALWADPGGGGPGLGELVCATWAVLSYFPFIRGLFGKGRYGLPWPTIAKASVSASLRLLLLSGGSRGPAMASSFLVPARSSFWGAASPAHLARASPHRRPSAGFPAAPPGRISAKFRLSEILGGRGLCNGEEGLRKFLNDPPPASGGEPAPPPPAATPAPAISAGEGAFEKELLGLTGGFPGGEKGLKKFIQENPPPSKASAGGGSVAAPPKPRPPELPLLMPGMIVIVKNPSNPYHMYCGTVQRVTDGMAGVLFEGGNWDKLLSFRLDELERREKGPPMVNPKSAILEPLVEKES